jgi:hypothetical protein
MEIPKLLNIIGLVFDITGALLLYFNTPHPSNITWIGTSGDIENDMKREGIEKRYTKFGIILLGTGFSLQLISSILG